MEAFAGEIKPLTFSRKERVIALILLPPFAVLLNFVIFSTQYFSSTGNFLLPTGITLSVIVLVYICCGMIAVSLRNRFPKYSQTFRRIAIGLAIYVTLTLTALSILFWGYDYIGLMGYQINLN